MDQDSVLGDDSPAVSSKLKSYSIIIHVTPHIRSVMLFIFSFGVPDYCFPYIHSNNASNRISLSPNWLTERPLQELLCKIHSLLFEIIHDVL